MLAVQVQYWDMRERMRHNKVAERQTDRSLYLQEESLEETKRHNVATETFNYSNLAEVQRHNLATESLSEQANSINLYRADTDRLNAQTNMRNAATNAAMIPIQWYQAESTRMNVENSKWYNEQRVDIEKDRNEISRFQSVAGASTSISQAATAGRNADTNYINAQTGIERNEIQSDYNKAILQYNYDSLNESKRQFGIKQDWEERKFNVQQIQDYILTGWRNLNESFKQIKDH